MADGADATDNSPHLPAITNNNEKPQLENKSIGQASGSSGRRYRASLPLFVFNLSAMLLFCMIGSVYTGGVIRTIERRFSLRSSQTGFLFSCNDIIQTSFVVFVGYFGRKAHKPRILSVTVFTSALAFLLMASPHWLFDSASSSTSAPPGGVSRDNNTARTKSSTLSFCAALSVNNTGNEWKDCGVNAKVDSAAGVSSVAVDVHPAYYVFIIAQVLSGVGSTGLHSLSLAYIDENAPRSKSSLYIGIVTSMYAFGPVGGFMLAAITLRLPENIMSSTSEKPEDPTFIGCWWLGYIVCAIGIMLTSIPMWFFPKSFVDDRQNGHQRNGPSSSMTTATSGNEKPKVETVWTQVKEFPKGLMHLLRNKPYIVMLGCIVTGAYLIVGVFVNMVRYIEIHFFERAFVASSITALVSALAGAIGGFGGGFIMSRMRLSPVGAVRLMIFTTSFFAAGLLVITFLSCPQVEMAGKIDSTFKTLSVLNDCNQQCACATDRKSYSPVCGSDNLTYFSACFAGCTDVINGTYVGCSCVDADYEDFRTNGPDSAAGKVLSTARPGLCVPGCNMLIPYAVIMFAISLIGSAARVPSTMVNFRIVDDDERSFALAINSFVMNLVGFIPAPILFGRLIDSSCRLWQRTAAITPKSSCSASLPDVLSGGTGSCLLYDTAKFRQRTYGVVFGVEVLDLLLIIVLYRLILNRKIDGALDGDVDNKQRHQLNTMNGNGTKCCGIVKGEHHHPQRQHQHQQQQPVDSEIKPEDKETVV